MPKKKEKVSSIIGDDVPPEFKINPLADLPGKKYEGDSEISLKLEDFDNPDFDLYKLYNESDREGDYFGYLCTGKCYRFIRDSFLVSTHPRIHRAGFRSRYGVYMERSRHLASFPYIIHPYSTFRWSWDVLVTIALFVTLVRQPILISFMSEFLVGRNELIYSSLLSLLFLLDIVLNFRTGIVKQKSDLIVLDPALITRRYLSTWFFVDLISTIPYDTVLLCIMEFITVDKKQKTYFKYIRLLELLKIFRLSRVIRYVTRFQEAFVFNTLYIRVINLHIVIFFTLHWISCMHFLVADMFNTDIVPPKPYTWVTQLDLWHKPVFVQYINSVIRALSNMACLGYGNEVPREPEDIVTTIVSIMIGATFFALFVGNLSSILINKDVSQKKYVEVLNQVMEYMRFKQVPKELQNRVILYYEQRYRRNFFNETAILENVSDVLRRELQMFNCRSLVEAVPLFQGLPQGIIQGIVARLKFEVYLPHDIIINSNTIGESMYFIEHGSVSVLAPSGRSIAQLKDGDFFGELALITNERRYATVVATGFCDIYQLHRKDFEEVIVTYPEVYDQLAKIAEERVKELGKETKADVIHQSRQLQRPLKTVFRPKLGSGILKKNVFKQRKGNLDDSL